MRRRFGAFPADEPVGWKHLLLIVLFGVLLVLNTVNYLDTPRPRPKQELFVYLGPVGWVAFAIRVSIDYRRQQRARARKHADEKTVDRSS